MLCESEMEVEQHTCWSGRDVVESYAGRVVGSTLKSQRENPEVFVRNTDPVLTAAKQKLEQLTQELLVELGWARKTRVMVEEEEGGSAQAERGSGDDCDDEDGCAASGEEDGGEMTADTFSGRIPGTKSEAPPPPPPRPGPPHRVSPPQVAVRGSAHTMSAPRPATLLLLLVLLSV